MTIVSGLTRRFLRAKVREGDVIVSDLTSSR